MRRFSVLMPILYLALIAFLLSLEFAGTTRVESERDQLSLDAWIFPGNAHRSQQIRAMRLASRHLAFDLGYSRGLTARLEGGSRERLPPVNFEAIDGGYRITFPQGIELEAISEPGETATLQYTLVIPPIVERVLSVEVPLEPAGGSTFQRTANSPVILVSAPEGHWTLSLPDGASYDGIHRRLVIPGTPGTYTLRSSYQEEPDEGTLASWFADGRQTVSAADLENQVDDYLEAAWSGWREDRYNGELGTWSHPDGGERFDERIAIALLAEAWERDDWSRVVSAMRNARALHREQTSYRIAPFLGDLSYYAPQMRESVSEKREAIRADLAREDPRVFLRDDRWSRRSVFEYVGDHDGESQVTELIALAVRLFDEETRGDEAASDRVSAETHDAQSSAPQSEWPYEVLLSLYEARYIYGDRGISDSGTADRQSIHEALNFLEERVQADIVSRVRNTESGFFVQTHDSHSDVALSLRSGRVLAAMNHEDTRVKQLGRRLVSDALGLGFEEATLPQALELDGSSIVSSSGSIAPEELYPFLSDNQRLPRAIEAPQPLDENAFIWTVADVSELASSSATVSMVVDSPADRTHYLLVYGVPSLTRAALFGLENWRDDPAFENYIRGRHFNSEAQTLKIKYTDELSRREIALHL